MIPKMPALGLLLECPVFEAYNRKDGGCERTHSRPQRPRTPPADRLRCSSGEIIEEFKSEHIYARDESHRGKAGRVSYPTARNAPPRCDRSCGTDNVCFHRSFDAWVLTPSMLTQAKTFYTSTIKGNIPPESPWSRRGNAGPTRLRRESEFNSTGYTDSGGAASSSAPLPDLDSGGGGGREAGREGKQRRWKVEAMKRYAVQPVPFRV
jgi:hypothetical protein